MTNADKIRAMSDEELADYLHKFSNCIYCPAEDDWLFCEDCQSKWLKWLKKEVEE